MIHLHRSTAMRGRLGLLLAAALLSAGCGGNVPEDAAAEGATEIEEATFVGGEACVRCHPHETRSWQGSHHDLAMQEASEATVLGDFDDATFTYAGVTSRFFRRDGGFWVRTDGPDGEMTDYEISYTFGAEPLQQYLIEFPAGRLQALSLCWDARPAGEGGQRWFHLYPDEAVDHADPLHWTGLQQNWNHMCAECHSTQLEKRYDLATDSFDTVWEEIDVSCEACHGPGSNHLAWADLDAQGVAQPEVDHLGLVVRLTDPGRGTWIISPETRNGMRLAEPVETDELEVCARCHSRRGLVHDEYDFGRPLLDTHRLALLEERLYHADGQILDEVYVHGSYLQSKMFANGVTCSDCHDPHSLTLLFPGDDVCSRCHEAARYETPEHHFHEAGKPGAFCVDCHMPPQLYMVVDPRHDHSLRVPRPDLSLRHGTPDACSSCHDDKPVEWSAEAVERWYGPERRREEHYVEALAAGRSRALDAETRLVGLVNDPEASAIVRATALDLLQGVASQSSRQAVESATGDDDPLVRYAAVRSAEIFEPAARLRIVEPLLGDPVRTVRIEAGRVLAGMPAEAVPADRRLAIAAAIEEYREAQRANLDRPESHLNLGWLESIEGDFAAAEASYRRAIALAPHEFSGYVNLADLYRQQQRDGDGEAELRKALEVSPGNADVHYALGLALVRLSRPQEALDELERAALARPEEPRYAYVLGVALNDLGQPERALEVLAEARRRHPADLGLLAALATISRDVGSIDEARDYARELVRLAPADPGARQLLEQLGG